MTYDKKINGVHLRIRVQEYATVTGKLRAKCTGVFVVGENQDIQLLLNKGLKESIDAEIDVSMEFSQECARKDEGDGPVADSDDGYHLSAAEIRRDAEPCDCPECVAWREETDETYKAGDERRDAAIAEEYNK